MEADAPLPLARLSSSCHTECGLVCSPCHNDYVRAQFVEHGPLGLGRRFQCARPGDVGGRHAITLQELPVAVPRHAISDNTKTMTKHKARDKL
jgi:hypothetical protein